VLTWYKDKDSIHRVSRH